MDTISNLKDVLAYYTADLYHAEKLVQKGLLKCISLVHSEALKAEAKKYIDSSQDKIIKLEEVLADMLVLPETGTNNVMEMMLGETSKLMHRISPDHLKDAVFLACIQRISHHKIAGYGTASAFAAELRLSHIRQIFNKLLGWEKEADEKLTWLAVKQLNKKATEPPLLLGV